MRFILQATNALTGKLMTTGTLSEKNMEVNLTPAHQYNLN